MLVKKIINMEVSLDLTTAFVVSAKCSYYVFPLVYRNCFAFIFYETLLPASNENYNWR